MTYRNPYAREYNPGLRKWRRDVIKRDNYTCQRCFAKGTKGNVLHAHHIEPYERNPELRVDVDNGITYCNADHKFEHTRLAIITALEYERGRGQKDRVTFYEHRLETSEKLNTVELIKERGYVSYWVDATTHKLPRRRLTKSEARLEKQIDMIMLESMETDKRQVEK